MRNQWSLLVAASLWAASTVAFSQAPAPADKAAAPAGAASSSTAPKRDLNAEAMKGMGSQRSTMSGDEQKKRAAEKAEVIFHKNLQK